MNHTVTLRDTTMTIDIYTFCTRIATTHKCGGYRLCGVFQPQKLICVQAKPSLFFALYSVKVLVQHAIKLEILASILVLYFPLTLYFNYFVIVP